MAQDGLSGSFDYVSRATAAAPASTATGAARAVPTVHLQPLQNDLQIVLPPRRVPILAFTLLPFNQIQSGSALYRSCLQDHLQILSSL